MKYKRRKVSEVPPKIKSFIRSVTSFTLEKIEEPLKGFTWDFDKGDFHHWVDLFNHFDSFYEKYIKSRKDLQLDDNFLGADPPFPREAVLQILRVTQAILENCSNKHLYSSFEQHLSSLLASTDADVVEASLQTLNAFLKKPVRKGSIRDSSLTSKLFSFSHGWGSKEGGLGLTACSLKDGCDPIAFEVGSTVHFEFYVVPDSSQCSGGTEHLCQGLRVIHLPSIDQCKESELELMDKLVREENVPHNLRFSLLTRLRFARAFNSLAARHQYICIRLYAFIILVQASTDTDDLLVFFNNEPEFISELVSLLSYESEVPEKIRVLGILSLVALCQDRSHQSTVLTSVTTGGHCGVLPSLMQKTVDYVVCSSGEVSIVFAGALLSLVSVLVSSTPGSLALQEAGYIPTILPLLKDTDPKHLQLVGTAVHIIEGFLDFNNPTAALFRDLGGFDDTITRLKIEVAHVENSSKRNSEGILSHSKGKQITDSSEIDMQPHCSEASISYQRKLLLKALLRAISLATYVPGSSARIDGSEESMLPHCLRIIFQRAKDFGGGVFSLAAIVMSDLIHKDPTCYPVLDAAGLPQAFLDAVMNGVLCSAEAVACILQCLDALCLNNAGLQLVRERNALRCFVKIFTSRSYLKALSGDIPGSLSNSLDELMRHASSLRTSCVDMLVEILSSIANIGCISESNHCSEFLASSVPVPMETDCEEKSILSSEGEIFKSGSSDQMIDSSSDAISLSVECFLPECIGNTARLLETVLQNAEICRLFIEKKGIEAILKLFLLPSIPISVSIGQNISVAFKNLSPQYSAALARTVCSFVREHVKLTNELLDSLCGSKLADIESEKQMVVLRCMCILEGLLSLVNFLLKGTTTMISELGSSDADILIELGKVYRQVLWQISLSNDFKVEERRDADHEVGIGDTSVSTNAERESDDDGSSAPVLRYNNPVSIHNNSTSHWNTEHEFVSYVPIARNGHRHGRHNFSRIRGSRLSRNMDISQSDSDVFANSLNNLLVENKKKSPIVLVSDVLLKLGYAIHSFHATLVKGLSSRRRTDSSSLSSTSKSIVTALAKVFHDALTYSGHSSAGLEMPLSVKCRYLGKVAEEMGVLVFDSRRRACNAALVNSFYVNGTFKEILTTFEATSQLLLTLPFPFQTPERERGTSADGNLSSESSWLLDTFLSYCSLLEYHVNSSLLLSPSLPSQSQLLVQPVATGLSIGLFPIPRDSEAFVRMLQSQVLDVILPLWTHPMFPTCIPAFISTMVSIVTHIYAGVGNIKRGHGGAGSTAQRVIARPIDQSSIATIVEMGFSRVRAEEALRNVGTNSVAIATDWLFNHPEEFVQEDVQLAQALALSLGNSSETSKDDGGDETKNVYTEDRGADIPPFDEIMSVSMKLLQGGDSMVFPLTDLLVTLCNRNKGEDRRKVVLYFIQQMKHYLSDFSKDIGTLLPISHILALILSEDSSTREIAAENGVVSVIIDILENVRVRNNLNTESVITKFVSALLLILNCMLQHKTKVPEESSDGFPNLIPDSSKVDVSLPVSASVEDMKSPSDCLEKEPGYLFENILGKSTGYFSIEESQRAMTLTCDFVKQQVTAMIMQAVLQLCARLTKTYVIATQFLENGTLPALFNLPRSCIFPGFDTLASTIIRHLLEDPQTLQTAMELEIRQALSGSHNRHTSRLSPRLFLTSMAPVISRNPAIFMRAAVNVCQLESSGGRTAVVLTKEKDKDKPKTVGENGTPINEPLRLNETRLNDTNAKCTKSHKRAPANLAQVIDQLLEIVMSYPPMKKHEDNTSSFSPMEVDKLLIKEKGKSKVDDLKMDPDGLSEKSSFLAKVTFVLRLMSDILLMYLHAVGVVLKRDSEMCSLRGPGQGSSTGQGGVIHHILHELLHISSEKNTECSDELREKLSDKASWFLVVLCGRSMEGRKRVIAEIVKTFSSFSVLERNNKSILLPDKNVLVFVDLVYSILSKNPSNNVPGSGCSPDIAKTMIDGGMVQALSSIIGCIDLDHPDATKVVNLTLKALECLTRAANTSDQVLKVDGTNKKRSSVAHERVEEPNNINTETTNHDQNVNPLNPALVEIEEQQIEEFLHDGGQNNANLSQNIEHEIQVNREEHDANPTTDRVQFMRQEINESGVIQNSNDVGLDFRIEQHVDDEMADDDEDMGDDGDDDDEDEEDDDDNEDMADEGTGLMSLAGTDVDDHDDSGLVEYNNDMIDEEDDDFPENHVIEVRWREGLNGYDRLRVLRGSGNASGFVDIASEPFRGITTDDIFSFQHSLGFDRRRPNSNRSVDRSGFDGNAFQHPLLRRPSLSGGTGTSNWPSAGNTSRNSRTLSFGSADLAHLYMFDSGLSSEHAAATFFGNNLVGSAPPSFIDFSFGMDSLQMGPRRGTSDSRWTDDGQPQAGNNAAAIAQAVEEQFVSQLRGILSVSNTSTQRPSGHSVEQNHQSTLLIANGQGLARIESDPFEPGEFQHQETGFESAQRLENVASEDPSTPFRGVVDDSFNEIIENEGALEARRIVIDDPNVSASSAPEQLLVWNEFGPTTIPSHNVPEMVMSSADLHNIDQRMPHDSGALPGPMNTESHSECRPGHTGFESHSNCQAFVDSGSTMPTLSDGCAGSSHPTAGFDMNALETVGNQVDDVVPTSIGELSTINDASIPPEASQNHGIVNESSSMNGIDPTFLEALPDDLRAEVLASQQAQSAGTSTYAPPAAEEIDPEFLAALPPDIQAEVLAQQRAQRDGHVQNAQGQPVDMDNASIIATFPPELREEVLLTSSDAVLSALPSALLAEAQMLRDRAASHYSARSSLFGGSQRLSSRRLTVDRQAIMDRGVGATIAPRAASAIASNLKAKETEGMPLLDVTSLKSLIRLLRVAQPLGKGLLQRLLLNLCAHKVTRATLVILLVDILKPEADALTVSITSSQRLYGCQWFVTYGQPKPSLGLPPLLSRRVLKMLTYLATNHPFVASILFNFDLLLPSESSACNTILDIKKGKTKEGICEPKDALSLESSQKSDAPIVLFLKLLNRPLFLRSNVHLEEIMRLIQVIVDNAVAKIDCQSQSMLAAARSETQADSIPSNSLRESTIMEQNHDRADNSSVSKQQPNVAGEESFSAHNTFLQLPKPVLCNLCSILAHAGLSEKVYSLVADVMEKLAFAVVPHQKFFIVQLAGLAQNLCVSAVGVLATLRSTHMLALGAGSLAGAAILRVLQALSTLIIVDGTKSKEFGHGHDEASILINLNVALEPLWQELSDCITATETKLGQNSTFSSSLSVPDASHPAGGRSTASPLPPGTQQLLPFIEAFFIICERLQIYQIMLADDCSTAGEKEFAGVSVLQSSPAKSSVTGSLSFARIVEKHRRLLNVFLRQNPRLLEKSFSMMLKVPRLIDFDNKRAYFRSRIRQQHDQHPSAPLRVSIRRAYVLEDSYNQLRLRSAQDLKGRLMVHFQGEEGIDAGGLTREWYQLLSRVIFDKGALLFTTVGNNATFQPNPNSVYQTEHLSYFKFVGRLVAKALFDGQLLDVYFTRSFYKHILGVKVSYHDIEAVDPDYYKNLKWMLENDVSDLPDLTFSMDADEEKHILYEKNEVTDYELKPGGRNIRVTEETKHEYVDLVAEHRLSTAIRPQINSFLQGFDELVPRDLISIFNDKELELLISGLPEIDVDDLKANTEYTGYTAASTVVHWFWEVVKSFNKEDMARLLQFVTGTSKVPLEGFKALQGISGSQKFQIHKAYGAPERLPSAHTCFNQLDLPEYSSKEQLEERLMLAIHEASEGFGFG